LLAPDRSIDLSIALGGPVSVFLSGCLLRV
jgi:hypothetical protein